MSKKIYLMAKLSVLACLMPLATISYGYSQVQTQQTQQALTPQAALQQLKQGNIRFIEKRTKPHHYIKQARLTAKGQHPSAIVLSCIDSRVPPEVVFDQPIGNIFVARVAANVLNKDVLGGMEFATKVSGAKLIVVLGHDSCGAVRGACDNVKLGHITQLVNKVKPAIEQTTHQFGHKECNNPTFVNTAAANNVKNVVKAIPQRSPIIAKLVKEGKLKIVGAMYHIDTGKVSFFNTH